MKDTLDNPAIKLFDMPTMPRPYGRGKKGKKQQVSGLGLADILRVKWGSAGTRRIVVKVVIEQVGATPQMGVTSAFNFGHTTGVVDGVVAGLGLPVEHIAPITWKAEFNLNRKDKDLARTVASDMYPSQRSHLNRVKDLDRAEALLIVRYEVERRARMRSATGAGQ